MINRLALDSATIVFYHDDCMDGLYAAWCVWRIFHVAGRQQPTYIPYDYHRTSLELELTKRAVDGQVANTVLMLDCSVSPDQALKILRLEGCSRFMIVDHHKSAYEALMAAAEPWTSIEREPLDHYEHKQDRDGLLEHHARIIDGESKRFDYYYCAEMSGAELAFHLFCAGREPFLDGVPWWIDYLADRDLWRHELPHSRHINRGLWRIVTALDHSFERMQAAAEAWGPDEASGHEGTFDAPYSSESHAAGPIHFINFMKEHGERAQAGLNMMIADCARRSWPFTFEGQPARAACAPRALRSEVGEALAALAAVALVWDAHPDGTVNVSLRSTKGSGPDVSLLAIKHGGGGHKHASGFVCSMAELHQIIYGD